MDGTIPISVLTGEDAAFFRLDGDELFLNSQPDKNFDKQITIIARDVEDQSSFSQKTVRISTSNSVSAAVGAGIACGVSAVLLVLGLVIVRQCQLQKRYKLYDQISRSRQNLGKFFFIFLASLYFYLRQVRPVEPSRRSALHGAVDRHAFRSRQVFPAARVDRADLRPARL